MTTFAVQKLYSPLEWNVSGTRRLKGSKFSESEKSMYVQHLCYVGKKKYYNLFYRTYDFIPHKIFAAVSFKKRKKVTYLGFSVFLFALVFLFLLMSSENEVLRCLSKCDKTAITWRSIVENFAYDGASFKKESFFFWYVDVKADGLITRNSHTNASWSNKEKFNAPLTKYAIV